MTEYKLQNYSDGNIFEDTGWLLSDPKAIKPSLIRAVYKKKELKVGPDSLGIYKYADWLPVNRFLKNSSSTVTYKSIKLSERVKLGNLFISFSGYWPEIGADMSTCSFKETEAYSVCARLTDKERGVMVVASVGNTARAFAKVCSDNNIPLLLIVPEDNLDALWFAKEINENVKLICTPSGTDYYDAIELCSKVCSSPLFFEEGGAKNVARRDGMGTTVLSAATKIGEIPDFYFQAIGSGTGTIAAWEANLRLIEDGNWGKKKMTLIPSQNAPFTPMYDAWRAGCRDICFADEVVAKENALMIKAKVLSNRRPPYSIPGGLYDALKDCNGDVESVTNNELDAACSLFKECEGIDIHPAAGVALAGMIKSLERGNINRDSLIMLNITGGGEERFKRDNRVIFMKPNIIIDNRDSIESITDRAERIFRRD
jgi:cysteate synthase